MSNVTEKSSPIARHRRSMGMRRPSARIALEPRIMFDGAGVATGVDALTTVTDNPLPQETSTHASEGEDNSTPGVAPDQVTDQVQGASIATQHSNTADTSQVTETAGAAETESTSVGVTNEPQPGASDPVALESNESLHSDVDSEAPAVSEDDTTANVASSVDDETQLRNDSERTIREANQDVATAARIDLRAGASSAPSDLSSGIELNTDGGNDAYLFDNSSGLTYLDGLNEVSMEFTFSGLTSATTNTFFVHTNSIGDHAHFNLNSDGRLDVAIESLPYSGIKQHTELFDGQVHSVAFTLDTDSGRVDLYVDGEHTESIVTTAFGPLTGGGTLVLGQHPSFDESGFSLPEHFSGTLHDVRIWDHVRSSDEIALNYQHKLDVSASEANAMGLVANWQMQSIVANQIIDIAASNHLSVGHVSEAGFTTSTPVYTLNIDENASAGTAVGFIVPHDSGQGINIANDSLFLDSGATNTIRVNAGQTFGGWTVDSGNIDIEANWLDNSPMGGHPIGLNGDALGSISQTVTTDIGTAYQVVFSMSGDFDLGGTDADLRVSAGTYSEDITYENTTNWSTSSLNWNEHAVTFVANTTSTVLSFSSLSASGPVIGDVRVFEVPKGVQTILANDASLDYNAATQKFYRVESSLLDFSSAIADAASAGNQISGVAGQLVTIDSASENAYVHSLITTAGINKVWIGGTDAAIDGEWRWINGTVEDEQFANSTGNSVNGQYTNFDVVEPNGGSAENALELLSLNGQWNDIQGNLPQAFVIEWDASQILSQYTFAITDASSNFDIDADTGEITARLNNTLDYESDSFHDVSVTVTDSAGQSYIETVRIQVNDLPEASSPLNTVPGDQTVDEDAVLTFSTSNSNSISVSDQQLGDSRIQVVLHVPFGTGILTLSQTTNLSIPGGSNANNHMVLEGTESDINAALNGMTFTPSTDFAGPVSLSVETRLSGDLEGFYTFENSTDPGQDTSVGLTQSGSPQGGTGVVSDVTRSNVLLLDGVDDAVVINSTFNNPPSVAVGAWVDLTGTGRSEVISIDDRVHLTLDEAGSGVKGSVQTGPASWVDLKSDVYISGTGWHHVMYVFDDVNNAHSLYLDGQLLASQTINDSIDYTGASTTFIGQHPATSSSNFQGQIDDVRIYTRALSGGEVASIAAEQYSDFDTITINVSPINDSPVVSLTGGAVNYIENGSPVFLDTTAKVDDIDSIDFNAGTLTASVNSGGTANDILAINNQGSGIGEVGVSGNDITYEGVIVGSATGGIGGSDLVVVFNGNANASAAQALAQNITYENTSDAPSTIVRNIRLVATDGDGGTSNIAANNVIVVAENDAPILDNSFDLTLSDVTEDASNPTGDSVANILASDSGNDPVTDFDTGSVEGIAVTGVDNSIGTWQYNTGSGWASFGVVSDNAATLLVPTALIRFIPNADQVGNGGTLTFRAWDQTSGSNGQTGVNVTTNGGVSAFSSNTETATIEIIAVNDEQQLAANSTLTLNEGASAQISSTFLATTDIDNTATQITYTVSGPPVNGQLELSTNVGVSISSFTQANIDNNELIYSHNGTNTTSDSFNFSVDDGAGTDTTATFQIVVTPVNSNAPDIRDTNSSILENSATGTVVANLNDFNTGLDIDIDGDTIAYTIIGGNTHGAFGINSNTGEITVVNASAIDYELHPQYVLTVQANDGTATDNATVTIDLTNTNDNSPSIILNAAAISENSINGSLVADLNDTNTNGDIDIDGDSITYTITAGNADGIFTINGATGVISVLNNTLLDYEYTNQHLLSVDASDGTYIDQTTVSVSVLNLNDNSPVVNDVSIAINENSAAGTLVHDVNNTSTGDDTDLDNDGLNYSIIDGNSSNIFEIDPLTGQIRVNNAALLDYESDSQFILTVVAQDGLNQANAFITVNLNDVNEAPSIQITPLLNTLTQNMTNTSGVKVGEITLQDDALGDNQIVLTGTNAKLFEIRGTELYLRAGITAQSLTIDSLNVEIGVLDPTLTQTSVSKGIVVNIGVEATGPQPPVNPGPVEPSDPDPITPGLPTVDPDTNPVSSPGAPPLPPGGPELQVETLPDTIKPQADLRLGSIVLENSDNAVLSTIEFTQSSSSGFDASSISEFKLDSFDTLPQHTLLSAYQQFDEQVETALQDINVEYTEVKQHALTMSASQLLPVMLSNQLLVLIDAMGGEMTLDEDVIVKLEFYAGAVTFTISFTYLLWMSKGLSLASSLAMVRSISHNFDPLTVLTQHAKRFKKAKSDDSDEIDRLFG